MVEPVEVAEPKQPAKNVTSSESSVTSSEGEGEKFDDDDFDDDVADDAVVEPPSVQPVVPPHSARASSQGV